MPYTLLLFDIDGVLVQPKGYKLALRDTVNYFAQRLGFAPVDLSMEDIGIFEACGLTNEWDSAAMCVGAMLATVARSNPATLMRWQSITDVGLFFQWFHGITTKSPALTAPDFRAIAEQVKAQNPDDKPVTPITHQLLRAMIDTNYIPLLDQLFADIFSIDTPTTHVQQTFTLGHERFKTTYGIDAPFESESYLLKHDAPLLSPENRDKLIKWRDSSFLNGFSIYTARPSLPAKGDSIGYAPEAELARELLGFDASVPLIAGGKMQWLATQKKRSADAYIKPSPVQALAAICAASNSARGQDSAFTEAEILEAAAELYENQMAGPPYLYLYSDVHNQVTVFEDSTGGITAVRNAAAVINDDLQDGIRVIDSGIGISDEVSKQAALHQVADVVFPDINAALDAFFHDT